MDHILSKGYQSTEDKHWVGNRREPEEIKPKQTWKRSALEEAGKFGKTWSEIKRLKGNRVRWR